MTVEEFIEKLKKYPQDWTIVVRDDEHSWYEPVAIVEELFRYSRDGCVVIEPRRRIFND